MKRKRVWVLGILILMTTTKCREEYFFFTCRDGYFKRVRSLRDTSVWGDSGHDYEENDSNELESDNFDDFFSRKSTKSDLVHKLKKEVSDLKSQLNHLKRVLVLSLFDGKDDFRQFFSDIW